MCKATTERNFYDSTVFSLTATIELTSVAVLPVGLSWPVADALVLVEPQPGGARVLLGHALHARVEDVAHAGVGVSVESVQAGAQVVGALGRL